ncbi:hypothetical protein BT96DRAFT_990518 [Gymnopus androsaceus JB14]|uniref:Uncharacterized protein n=1 Tax=Gymnopus androsaceus JB14 TaxID=1447944 RepID=A0A6A4I325_9AGAR|nr:hypothetical protein BT96DRAFT_990518 [Gymnopus androsaceus JB14]
MTDMGYKINPPHGVWCQLTRLYPLSPPDTNFFFSDSPGALCNFVEQESISSSLSCGIAKLSDLEIAQFRDGNFNVWQYNDSYIFYRSQAKDTSNSYYVGYFVLPDTVGLQTAQVQHLLDFTQIQNLPYINIYSSQMPRELSSWYNDNKAKVFEVVHEDVSSWMTVCSPICPMCYAIHRECPLQTLRPIVPIPCKYSFLDNNNNTSLYNSSPSSAANSFKQPCTAITYSQWDSLLVRNKLVKSVVEHVMQDHFLLLSYDLTNNDSL